MKLLKQIILLVLTIAFMLFCFRTLQLYDRFHSDVDFSIEVKADHADDYQVFYTAGTNEWAEDSSIHQVYDKVGSWVRLHYTIPSDTTKLRLDVGSKKSHIELRNMSIKAYSTYDTHFTDLAFIDVQQIKVKDKLNNSVAMITNGSDPYFSFNSAPIISKALSGTNYFKTSKNILMSLIAGLLIYFIARYLRGTMCFTGRILTEPRLVSSLARNDFKTKYAASYLGVVWGFVTPLLTIVTYWFVFQVGLRSGNVAEVPFILWFIAGIVPWFFFSEALSGSTNVFAEYSYLVKKVVFKIELLPSVKIISSLYVHLFFILFIFAVYGIYGYTPTLYSLQLIYYLFSMVVLVYSLSLLTSSIVLFFKDLNQIISIILTIGFWFTPIGWSVTMLPDFWRNIFKLNPMYYIVQGFRDTFIDHILFYERPYQFVYFWILCLAILTLGTKVFKKLKPHFSDVI
ncbi:MULTISPECIES: ABC transporter permease [Paenibacillus]|uniref:Transport permease protein n=1 Tax=Paenibacillus polymyxa (strain SC2) TaxID=886882 RepID=E3EAL5_PAEPS|nr:MULTISPECIES: ABC transporter permease [Paenibacillus]ADO58773.1 ABC transporter permease [Paenibacillus polymyxa SC2]KZE68286.1 ABC transporter permease [Paenibacillus jamilae]WPQ56389.1 ABC transporter permease [Paenibacillus polymyxa]